MKNKKRAALVSCLAILSFFSVAFFVVKHESLSQAIRNKTVPAVLGKDNEKDEKAVFLYKNDNYEQGGLIEIASTDEPAIKIGSVGISGNATITTYQANYDDLLNYLIHNGDYEQKNDSVDVNRLSQVGQTSFQINADNDSTLPLPIGDNGVWFVRADLNGTVGEAFIIRTDIGSIASQGDDQIIIWNQNFKTKRLISNAAVTVYDLKSGIKKIETTKSDSEGIAKVNSTPDADIAIVESDGNKTVLPLNYKYLNTGNYVSFQKKSLENQYFVFTDRPLYRPGDNIKFKAIIRQEDDAVFTLAQGKIIAEIIKDYDESSVIAQKEFTISDKGNIDGEFTLPANIEPGSYNLVVKTKKDESTWGNNSISFDVEEFVKPEYAVEATTNDSILIAGDSINVNVHGGYFSGQPLTNEEVKYTVYSSPYGDYGYQDEFNPTADWHWSWQGNNVFQGTVKLNENGDASLTYKTPNTKEGESSKVYTIEAEYVNESGRPSVSTVNVLVKSGELGIYKKDYSWGAKVNEKLSMPFVIKDKDGQTVANNLSITIKTHWSHWKEVEKDGKTEYQEEKEYLPDQNINSSGGEFEYSFVPSKTGLYDITLSAKDQRGNVVENDYSVWAYSENEYSRYSDYGRGSSGITVKTDKEKYNPGDEAKITILSKEQDRDALLTMERGRTRRYEVIHLGNNETTVTEKIQDDDIPNIYANVSTFGAKDIDGDSANLLVSTDSKKINISLKPDRNTYGPGDMAVVDVSTTDFNGNPISADTAVWAIDKALYELEDSNTPNILDVFWYQRGNDTSSSYSLEGISAYGAERGGCFAEGTQVLMADHTKKNIEDVVSGDSVLTYTGEDKKEMVEAKVLDTEDAVDNGYLVINNKLHVTPDHILWVNNDWRQAGQIQIGDTLRGVNIKEKVYSIEWHREKTHVYNLKIENYHTYIADGIWVHNDKGGGGGMRTDLKDTAYWNPSIQTDASGHARISFKLPDNLTTWVIASIADTDDAKVGQQTAEVVVSKNIIVRPMLPNVLQEGDKIVLGAMVQNFSDSGQKMNVEANFDSGTLENATQEVTIAKGSTAKVYWNVSPQTANDHAKFSVKATAIDRPELNDGIVQELPVRKFGFPEISGTSMINDGQFPVTFPKDAFNDKSSVKVEVSASLIGSLSSAMDYLLEYPYGCVEQTTSSFVPSIIFKQNKSLFQFKKTDISVDDVANKGIARLKDLQNSNGGWGWWGQDNKTNPFISAYVAEYLFKAKRMGYGVDNDMYDSMLTYLKSDPDESATPEEKRLDKIGKTYALSIIEKGNHSDRLVRDFNGLTPDILSLAVMANINNGNMNPAENGLDALIALAQNDNGNAYWNADDIKYFGSKEASTALALRALIAGKGNPDLIDRTVKYLTQERRGASWQNTFATAQVLQAMVDYAQMKKFNAINSSYAVLVDGQEIAQGKFNDYRQINSVNIPIDKLQTGGSQISIRKDGEGDVYSTIIATAFRTDKNAGDVNKGFSVTRSYKPEGTDDNSPLAVGDVVDVSLTVKSDFDDKYVVIEDHLPSGLVPINPKFKNEQASGGGDDVAGGWEYGDNREVTKDGMIISVEDLPKGTKEFTYRARVVSQGEFNVIPAVVTKMYAPDIYGRTAVQKVVVQKERESIPSSIAQKKNILLAIGGIIVILALLGGGGYYLWKRKQNIVTPQQ